MPRMSFTLALPGLCILALCFPHFRAFAADNEMRWPRASIDTRTDASLVLDTLEMIRERHARHQKLLAEICIKGKFDSVRPFTFWRRHGKARLDFELDSSGQHMHCYRLDDGDALMKMDANSFSIGQRGGDRWRAITSMISDFEAPLFFEHRLDVAERCAWLIDFIAGAGEFAEQNYFSSGDYVIALNRTDADTIVIELQSRSPGRQTETVELKFLMEVAPRQSFQLVRLEHYDGDEDPAQWTYHFRVDNEYNEVAPDIWVIEKGVIRVVETGHVVESTSRQGQHSWEIIVDSVQLGDFIVDSNHFTIQGLPILPGTRVHDFRVQPESVFVFGEGTVDEGILQHSAKKTSSRPAVVGMNRRRLMFLVSQLVTGLILLVLYLVWRRKGRQK